MSSFLRPDCRLWVPGIIVSLTIGHGRAAIAQQPDRAASDPATAAEARSGLPILTLDRFEQAMQIARLAAEHDKPGHGVDAVRVSLRAGPPVAPTDPNELRRVIRAPRGLDDGALDPVSPKVLSYLVELERLWQRHHVPAESVYLALREAVLPPARPSEIFLYAGALNVTSLGRPQSVGARLASAAVRAGKVDDLRRTLATRQGQVMAELPSAILSTQLAIAASDPAGALKGLRAIAARLKNDSSQASAVLACHAALPALNQPTAELSTSALDVLDGCVKGLESFPSEQGEPLGTLLIMMARRQFQLGDAPGGRKRLDAYLEVMEKNNSLYLRKEQIQRVAGELARAGLWSDALAALARHFDAPAFAGGYPPVDDILVRVLRRLATLPARERYETLRTWTMPAKDRRVVRLLTSLATRDTAPDLFARSEANRSPTVDPAGAGSGDTRPDLLSTATALIDAARQAGTLDQLAEEVRAAAAPVGTQKIETAEVLHLLVELARGQGTKVAAGIEGRLAALIKENEAHPVDTANTPGIYVQIGISGSDRVNFPWTDYLLARSTVGAGEPIGGLGLRLTEALVERAERFKDWTLIAIMRGDLAEATARRAGAPHVLAGAGLASWHPTNMRLSLYLSASEPASYWISHQGHIHHPSGSTTDLLLFDYPLTGSYEFSVDVYGSPRNSAVVVHNGLGILPSGVEEMGSAARVLVVGHTERIPIHWGLSRPHAFNRLTVQATPQHVRYLVNGHLFYEEDDPGPTSPWIGLLTGGERSSTWRNLSLRGAPIIPREVRLSQGDRLEGWVPSFYRETLPPRLGAKSYHANASAPGPSGIGSRRRTTGATTTSQTRTPKEPIELDDYDWAAQDGVIHGRRVLRETRSQRFVSSDSDVAGTEADQSRLYYQRPLHDGDSIDYEFLYEPGQVMVHPSIDRVAFLLEPQGVKVHWITAGGDDRSGLTADNAVEEANNRRGPKAIPLRPGEWNAMAVALDGDQVTLALNGQVIYERTMEPTLGRQFGLFHYKDQTAVQARNLVLRGRWPAFLTSPQMANLMAPDPAAPHSDADRRARHALIGEPIFALQAGEVVEESRKLGPDQRYHRLSDWVLPSPDHPVFRLEGDSTPSFPATSAPPPGSPGGNGFARGVRVPAGGEIRAPALELVDTARSLGKLDELGTRVAQSQVPDDDNRTINERGKRSLLALVQIARGDDVAASQVVEAMKPMLEKIPLDQPEWARWPELALASRAIERPTLRRPARAILETLAEQAGKKTPSALWTQRVENLLARAELLMAAERGGSQSAVRDRP